jgi:hypothetical protein
MSPEDRKAAAAVSASSTDVQQSVKRSIDSVIACHLEQESTSEPARDCHPWARAHKPRIANAFAIGVIKACAKHSQSLPEHAFAPVRQWLELDLSCGLLMRVVV